jgi:hypothetical protein
MVKITPMRALGTCESVGRYVKDANGDPYLFASDAVHVYFRMRNSMKTHQTGGMRCSYSIFQVYIFGVFVRRVLKKQRKRIRLLADRYQFCKTALLWRYLFVT